MTMKPVPCLKCAGGGIVDFDHARPGHLIPACPSCLGSGLLDADPSPPYRAAWLVGSRFVVRLTVELPLKEYHELNTDWYPFYPPKQGKGMLRTAEKRDHHAGITAALQQLKELTGARGDFSVTTADERH
jgi:hypothetical protein